MRELGLSTARSSEDSDLETLQRESFNYFIHEANPLNGLIIDKTAKNWPASIAATGLALTAYPVGVERGFWSRRDAVARTLLTMRFFWNSPQGTEPDATGYKGFYYHFLNMVTGRRTWDCELSTIDSAILLAGALAAGVYFSDDTADEAEIRSLADALYRRADWAWAQNGGATVTHGWRPESGFISYRCVRHQHQLDRMHDLNNGGFLAHRSRMENEDETEIRNTSDVVRTGCERHKAGDTEAVFG